MKKVFASAFTLLLLQTANSAVVSVDMSNNNVCYSSSDCQGELECVSG